MLAWISVFAAACLAGWYTGRTRRSGRPARSGWRDVVEYVALPAALFAVGIKLFLSEDGIGLPALALVAMLVVSVSVYCIRNAPLLLALSAYSLCLVVLSATTMVDVLSAVWTGIAIGNGTGFLLATETMRIASAPPMEKTGGDAPGPVNSLTTDLREAVSETIPR